MQSVGPLVMEGAIVTPLFTAFAKKMRPALFEVLRMPACLADQHLPTDNPRAAIRAFDSLYPLGSHRMHLRCPQPTAEASSKRAWLLGLRIARNYDQLSLQSDLLPTS
jgi:hypothetical protein